MGRLSSPQTHLPEPLPVFENITMALFFTLASNQNAFKLLILYVKRL